MGQKDLWQSDYFDNNVRFADAFNGILFHGNSIIKPEELLPCDPVMVQHFQNQSTTKVICDKIRHWKGRYLAIFPLENQSYVDYRMVLRIMQEEIMVYEKQRKQDYELYQQKGYTFTPDEYLSGMRKELKFIPVIPLILYLGTDSAWDGATTLYELLEIDEELKPFVNNYKLNFYDFREHINFSNFKTENRLLFEILANAKNKKKVMKLFLEESPKYTLDRETVAAMFGIAGIKVDLDKFKYENNGKVEYKMIKGLQDYMDDVRNEGYQSGMDDGYRASVQSLMDTMHLTLEQALDALKITGEARKQFYS